MCFWNSKSPSRYNYISWLFLTSKPSKIIVNTHLQYCLLTLPSYTTSRLFYSPFHRNGSNHFTENYILPKTMINFQSPLFNFFVAYDWVDLKHSLFETFSYIGLSKMVLNSFSFYPSIPFFSTTFHASSSSSNLSVGMTQEYFLHLPPFLSSLFTSYPR